MANINTNTYGYNVGNVGNATHPINTRLNPNEIFGSIFNMIISQQVFTPDLAANFDLVEKFRTDGSMFGDTKLFYSADVLATKPWTNDREAQDLLALHRPEDPEVQAVTIDQFRFIPLTVDNYLTKRAWSTENAFSQFNSVMLSMLSETRKIYDRTLINTFIGTTVSESERALIEIGVAAATQGLTGEEANRIGAQTIAQGLADLMVDLKDISRDFNDYKNLRAYNESDLMVIWNAKKVNKITKLDLPTIFHKDSIFNDFTNVLPERYFGEIKAEAVAKNDNNGSYRSLVETYYTTATSAEAMTKDNTTHVFPGDAIPSGTVEYDEEAKALRAGIVANRAYEVDSDIICKIIHKDSIPFMSAFTTSTSFFNPRSLTETHYLIWGYSNPVYLLDKPFVTVHED